MSINAKIRDHGPGICEVEGCGRPRYFFERAGHHAPVCEVHAWDRIKTALFDEEPPDDIGTQTGGSGGGIFQDRRLLIAEVKRLRAELAAAKAERDEARRIADEEHGHHVASAVGMGLSPCSTCETIDSWTKAEKEGGDHNAEGPPGREEP